ncbi:MAG: hypothetical protein PHE24_01135 [Patescibacteria group bacterium]|nr:hypothetical protein [Patescibacteria group bacterium]
MGLPLIHWLVIISAVISVLGSFAYIRDTLNGKTKPNRISWSMWALAPLIGTAAALYAHADVWATVRIFLAGFLPLLVFLVSFVNKQSYWKLTRFDLACGLCSVLALIVWALADSPRSAILLAALGDGLASLPTIRKAWTHPETETGVTFIASLVAVVLVLPSIPRWNIENSAFQIYLLIANTLILFSIYRKRLFGGLEHSLPKP